MTHVSHCYPDGASLYYTFIFPRDPNKELEQFWEVKRAGVQAIVDNGGTISHHHGVGGDHAPWLPKEKGDVGMGILKATKTYLDPKGILNPNKWL